MSGRELTLDMVRQARERLAGVIHPTPLDYSVTFSQLTGNNVYFKLENLQKTGSFKIRGAYNKISSLDEDRRRRGVIAASAGNHAQGVAYAATRAGVRSIIVMPERAPVAKVVATQNYGAEVILAGEDFDEASAHAKTIQKKTGATFVHSFDDLEVIAGQGTLALELLEELGDLDAVLVPVGGGGLIAGIAFTIKTLKPDARVIGVQATQAPSVYFSLKEGKRRELPPTQTIADGINVRRPGTLTLDLVRRYVDELVLVEEEEIAQAILMLLERSKTVVEGAGAVGVAALLKGQLPLSKAKVVVILSGGNIDMQVISMIIERGLLKSGRILRLCTVLPDRPGTLSCLLSILAEVRANVISINHDRTKPHVPLQQAEIELVLETRDQQHIDLILKKLAEKGYVITIV